MKVANIFKEMMSDLGIDPFIDPKYFPPPSSDPEDVGRYFIFMVAIDHRTSRYEPFEGYVDGEWYHGADLLYRLAMKKFEEDPEFFSPNKMIKITVEDVKNWLSVRSGSKLSVIWDPEVRAYLLRDIAVKLIKIYKGKVTELITRSGNRLKGSTTYGFIDRLKFFTAYSDPVEKKSYLLAKFLSRRKLAKFDDLEHAEVPVDNHLSRIALRLGLVKLPKDLLNKILSSSAVTDDEDIDIRLAIRKAFKVVAQISGMNPFYFDDLLWLFGRHCCTREKAICKYGCFGKCSRLRLCKDGCPLSIYCDYSGEANLLNEHYYVDTYYY
jgi:hypothetical protein